jgi:hypothetical protein
MYWLCQYQGDCIHPSHVPPIYTDQVTPGLCRALRVCTLPRCACSSAAAGSQLAAASYRPARVHLANNFQSALIRQSPGPEEEYSIQSGVLQSLTLSLYCSELLGHSLQACQNSTVMHDNVRACTKACVKLSPHHEVASTVTFLTQSCACAAVVCYNKRKNVLELGLKQEGGAAKVSADRVVTGYARQRCWCASESPGVRWTASLSTLSSC